jgi:hypothetical protein
VRDIAFIGNTKIEPVATPELMIGFVCAVIEVEKSYLDRVEACLRAMLRRYTELRVPTGRKLRRDPINYDPQIEDVVLPAYARVSQYRQLRMVRNLVYAANHLLDARDARPFIDNLIANVPALSGAMQRRSISRSDSQSAEATAVETWPATPVSQSRPRAPQGEGCSDLSSQE